MKRWFPRFPSSAPALLAGGLLIGVALAPVDAQPMAPADGQVAVRSDRAVYLITNGVRRWVATVILTDEELNAYPEGEPVRIGLAPGGSQTAASPSAPTAPGVSASPAPSVGTVTQPPTTTTGTTATAPVTAPAPPVAAPSAGSDLPIAVDIDGEPTFEPGERIILSIKTTPGAGCELAVAWPDGTAANQETKTADSGGRCRYSIEIAPTAAAGTGTLRGVVRSGGQTNQQDVEFEIIPATA